MGFLNKQLKDYKEDERNATIPLVFYNSVVSRDSRKMIISTQPIRFMMRSRMIQLQFLKWILMLLILFLFLKNKILIILEYLTALANECNFPSCVTKCMACHLNLSLM